MEQNKEASIDLQKQLEERAERLKYDTQAKNLFGLKEVMGYMLKFTVPEFADMSAEEAAKCILEVQISKNEVSENYGDGSFDVKKTTKENHDTTGRFQKLTSESKVENEKTIYFDIKTLVKNPKVSRSKYATIELVINLEMQNDNDPGYLIEQRGMYYSARLLSEQLGVLTETTDYSTLKKVYSIWIVQGYSENKVFRYHMVDQDGRTDHGANLLELNIIRLSKKEYRGKQQEVFDFLHSFFDEIPKDEKKKRLEKYFDFKANAELKEGVNVMCNLSEGIYQRGREEGILQGREQGILQGREEGILQGKKQGILQGKEEGLLLAAKKMIENGTSYEEVSKILGIPQQNIEDYMKGKAL